LKVEYKIRAMASGDLDAIRRLLHQLGYEIEPGELQQRIAGVANAAGHLVLVAEINGSVQGLVHAYIRPAMEKPPEPVIQALVVDRDMRRAGIARALMDEAENWAVDLGFDSISLHTQTARADAIAFYDSLGYKRATTSHLLRKKVDR
jgi:GNAT superfamily N-acetyltransferase